MAKKITGNKVDLASPSKVRWAKDDDPIYSEGWTIRTVGVWGRLPKPYPELAEPIREAGLSADKEGTDEQE